MKRKVGKEMSLREGARNLSKCAMNHVWLPCFKSNRLSNDFQKAREVYLSILEKGKQLGLNEEAHAEPVCLSENHTHPIVD